MRHSPALITHPLTYVRHLNSWTQQDVADIVRRRSGLNMATRREKIWRWECGLSSPEPVAQHALADELGIDRQLVSALGWPAWLLLIDPIEPTDTPWIPDTARQTLVRVVESAVMDRRTFVVLASGSLACAWNAAPPPPVADGIAGALIGSEAIKSLNARVEELWYLDDILGGGACLDAGRADLRMIGMLLKRATLTDLSTQRLLSTAASLGRFCGFAAFDSGLTAAAQRYWHAALRAAHAAGDTSQGVYVLSNLALQAIYLGNDRAAIDILDAARTKVDPAARTVLAMLDTWQARAYALAGEPVKAATLLNRADGLWQRRRPEDDPTWVYWMPQPSLTAEAGTALAAIGDLDNAEANLRAGLQTLDDNSARERNLYLLRIAETQLAGGRLDEAVTTARQTIDGAAYINSPRVGSEVDVLLNKLTPDDPRTAELRDFRREAALGRN
jgi:tetratricopeptide (TPR) repeat protein